MNSYPSPPSNGPLSEQEAATAYLQSTRTGLASGLFGRPEHWLLRQIETATHDRLHLAAALAEVRWEFPSEPSAWQVVLRLLAHRPAGVSLVWRRDGDNRLVFYGARPPATPYPQRPRPLDWQPGDYYWPTRAEAADWARRMDPVPA